MVTSRPVRIARATRTSRPADPAPSPGAEGHEASTAPSPGPPTERRKNTAGSQRVLRVSAIYLFALVALYVGFVLYDRTAPGGSASPQANGLLLLTAIFATFAVGGALFTLHPAPRGLEVYGDHVVVVGRWGRRRLLPPLASLSLRVVRRYPAGWLADAPVEQVELWGKNVSLRSYVVDADFFRGVAPRETGLP